MLKKIALCFLALASVALSACNTVEGAGKDVSATGQAVTDTARDVKHNM
jgi:predicted small secreted protein